MSSFVKVKNGKIENGHKLKVMIQILPGGSCDGVVIVVVVVDSVTDDVTLPTYIRMYN